MLFRSVNACECCGRACWSRVSFSVALHLTALRQGLMVNGKLIVSARLAGQRSQDVFVSALKWLGPQGMSSHDCFLGGCWGFKLGSSCLHSKCSHLPSHPTLLLLPRILAAPRGPREWLSYATWVYQSTLELRMLAQVSLLEVTQLYMEINKKT